MPNLRQQASTCRLQRPLQHTDGLDLFADTVTGVKVDNSGTVTGVKTSLGVEIGCRTLILTNGTFLNGIIHIGEKQYGGGRIAEPAAEGLTECLVDLGFESGRMKTGTPPRIDSRSLDFSVMTEQREMISLYVFHFQTHV